MIIDLNATIFKDFLDVRAFVEVAVNASFSKSAKRLGEPRATVSRRIARLEEQVGTRLLERTTRQVQLTPAGRLLLGYAERILEEMSGAKRSLEALTGSPSGRIRITAPYILGQALLGKVIVRFLTKFPATLPFLDLSRKRIDLVEEGYDVAVRLGPLPSSSLVAKRIGTVEAAFYATPGVAVEYGPLDHPHQFEDKPMLSLCGTDEEAPLQGFLGMDGQNLKVRVRPVLISTEPNTVLEATLSGLGLGLLPTFMAEPLVAQGALQRLLPDWAARRNEVYLVTPSNRLIRPAVKAFLAFAAAELGRLLGQDAG